MKKGLILTLAVIVVISGVFASCASKKDLDLESVDTEVGFEIDENGEEVAVVYETDKDGNVVAIKLGDDGEKVTDKKGKYVTVKTERKKTTTTKKGESQTDGTNLSNKLTTTAAPSPTGTTKKDVQPTSSKETTKNNSNGEVPKTSDSGKEVNFSVEEQQIIASMLEVPYLYTANYENSAGVPINIACHVAVWMAEHEGGTSSTYPSSPVVLNLFKYFGQTVVNFKTQCNEFAASGKAPITYNKGDDTFNISEYTSKVQSVKITSIEDLGGDNYYKVTADVSGCNKKKVVAIVQKNRLDISLGYSIKALKWS